MDMSKKIRNVVALVLVVCVLMPVTAFPLQYAPGSDRNTVLSGDPFPPHLAKTRIDRSLYEKPVSVYYYLILTPWMSIVILPSGFVMFWY